LKYITITYFYFTEIIQSLLIVILKHILGVILRNVHCAVKKYSRQSLIIILYYIVLRDTNGDVTIYRATIYCNTKMQQYV